MIDLTPDEIAYLLKDRAVLDSLGLLTRRKAYSEVDHNNRMKLVERARTFELMARGRYGKAA